MARIRTIKPEFWTSEQVMECSPVARLLFIGIWNFCDDAGRLPWSPKQIKAQIFPSDNISSEAVDGLLRELFKAGLIIAYEANGRRYLAVAGWRHQKIDRPQKPKYPAPPPESIGLSKLDDPCSSNDIEHSSNDHGRFATEGKGEEEEGKVKKKEGAAEAAPADLDLEPPASADIVQFQAYAYEGAIIRLKRDQFERWRKVYSAIPDLTAALEVADAYYAERPPKDGKWFFPVSRWLEKANAEAKTEKKRAGYGDSWW